MIVAGLWGVLFFVAGCSNRRAIEFDEQTWNVYVDHIYNEERFGMALWLIDEGRLATLSEEEVCRKLYRGDADLMRSQTIDGVLTIPLRNRKEHFGPFSWYDEHFELIDAYLKIHMRDGTVVRAEVEEFDYKNNEFVVTRSTVF